MSLRELEIGRVGLFFFRKPSLIMSTCYLVDNPDILLTVKKRSNQGEGQQFVPLGALEQSRHKKNSVEV